MFYFSSLIKIICKLMTISVVFTLVVFSIHEDMDAHFLNKDIIIHSYTNSAKEDKLKIVNLDSGDFSRNIFLADHYETDLFKPLTFISPFSLLNSSSSTILRL